jgi:hypothetical protein
LSTFYIFVDSPTNTLTFLDICRQSDTCVAYFLIHVQICCLVLDWISSKKITDAAASMMWDIVVLMMPAEVNVPTWNQIKRALRQAEAGMVERIDICPNDCIAYYNSKCLAEPYRHAHRTKCPTCDEARFVVDPSDGNQRARKVNSRHLTPIRLYTSVDTYVRMSTHV